ncbi:MAG: YdeI/OmpD-associated family protein [Ilumatobacteraceae bacterium]|nr:YdeI/OmpD-associated family protein [Ilumatobacteraceae bacterium]
MVAVHDKPILVVHTVAEWERFLEGNPAADGVRLQLRKISSRMPGITYAEALDAALCFGWIDGQRSALDDNYHLQVFTPRRPRSIWSQRNRDHVERLTAEGRMRPPGQAQVDRAKADGRWDAAYRQSATDVPPDLQEALDASPAAAAFFAQLSSQNRFAILFRIGNVKRADTRARKIATFVEMLERGETVHP